MKTGLAVLAALIGSADAKGKSPKTTFNTPAEGDIEVKGELYFFKHPTSGKPYVNINVSLKKIELKDGFALCFGFAPESATGKDLIDGKAGFPLNFKIPKLKEGKGISYPKAYNDPKFKFKDC